MHEKLLRLCNICCLWATAATHAVLGTLEPGISLKGPGPVLLIDPAIEERRCSCLTVRKTASSLASSSTFLAQLDDSGCYVQMDWFTILVGIF